MNNGGWLTIPFYDYNYHLQLLSTSTSTFFSHSFACCVSVRRVSPQRCSLSKVVNLRVLRPARCIHIHLRGRVLRNLPHPATVRSAGGGENPSRMASSGTGAILRVLVAHYGEKLVSSRALPSAFAAQYFVAGYRSLSCLRPLVHHANQSLAVPLRSLLIRSAFAPTYQCGVFPLSPARFRLNAEIA